MRLVLASASPRRRELLSAAGFTFDVVTTDVDERVRVGEAPAAYVRRLAREKAARAMESPELKLGPTLEPADVGSGSSRIHDVAVLGADTTVVLDGDILGKPASDDEGRQMLRRLSGRVHQVLTGLSLHYVNRDIDTVEATAVWFRDVDPAEVEWYVATGEGRDKAGGYAIQGLARRFIPRIEGSYSNVVGLPIEAVRRLLRQFEPRTAAVASKG